MPRSFFTSEEARQQVGRLVEALADFPSVPKGSRGKVVAMRQYSSRQWMTSIEWELPRAISHYELTFGDVSFNFFKKSRPIRDQFCKSEYETLLSVIH
jgi:hypothetical protein